MTLRGSFFVIPNFIGLYNKRKKKEKKTRVRAYNKPNVIKRQFILKIFELYCISKSSIYDVDKIIVIDILFPSIKVYGC
jgi:hypothetical protein